MTECMDNVFTERRLERVSPAFPVEVVEQQGGAKLGQVVNCHCEGLMVMGISPVQVKKLYPIRLRFRDQHGQQQAIHCTVDCLWHREGEDHHTWWSGYHIIDIDDQSLEQLSALVALSKA